MVYQLKNSKYLCKLLLIFLELTAKIARKVGVKTGKIELGKFKNGETTVMLNDNVRDKDIYIIQVSLLVLKLY